MEFHGENIKKNTYIVRYEGNISHLKPKNNKSYVVEINYEMREGDKDKKKTCYIDAESSTTNGRYVNHSCVNNAVIGKMLHPTNDFPMLWIKSRIDINENEEMLVNYGDEYESLLLDKGGCKCTKIYGRQI